MKKFSKEIMYKRKDGLSQMITCSGWKGFLLYQVIRFTNWVEVKTQ